MEFGISCFNFEENKKIGGYISFKFIYIVVLIRGFGMVFKIVDCIFFRLC